MKPQDVIAMLKDIEKAGKESWHCNPDTAMYHRIRKHIRELEGKE